MTQSLSNSKWNYGGYAEKYNMDGDIHVGTGVVRVHDIFNPLPAFMRGADVIFCDPPYNQSCLKSYYTKAGLDEKPDSFESFFFRLFECLEEISPRIVVLEVGQKQAPMYEYFLKNRYANVESRESYYYGNKKNKCVILFASNTPIPACLLDMPFMDEEKVIEYICKNLEYDCIGDLCMGKGLVAYYSNKYGKPFVGTELNPNRLAVCVERVTTGERGKIN